MPGVSTVTSEDFEQLEARISKPNRSVVPTHDFEDPVVLYDELIDRVRRYHPNADITMIEKAYQIADEAHKQQKRKSGEPYIIHPLCVAMILADLEMDKETIAAGLLHDVVEDTVMTRDEIVEEF
ncbi:MAG: bifunctional (p)ppGpp synthetase/guanosine-3',5'-bis(diphosphate) 3'-pyrophosphohydrolase, partial [Lachnospiraceae bacterium]|nr:bifunctional (p)ppGpp synthetase/guanosine-3',5'-bis(diphosphate) 3'-pyrophosphohydrolase [Lachnospiraceae bacterium]